MKIMRIAAHLKAPALALSVATGLYLTTLPARAVIDPYPDLSETAVDLVDKLENRHYSKRKFDDELSSLFLPHPQPVLCYWRRRYLDSHTGLRLKRLACLQIA